MPSLWSPLLNWVSGYMFWFPCWLRTAWEQEYVVQLSDQVGTTRPPRQTQPLTPVGILSTKITCHIVQSGSDLGFSMGLEDPKREGRGRLGLGLRGSFPQTKWVTLPLPEQSKRSAKPGIFCVLLYMGPLQGHGPHALSSWMLLSFQNTFLLSLLIW